ncbi:hypothetical protein ABT095_13875 [Kitasatospora sp. NPDC002227]|uniref:HAAS signaling domain-containing protein n=1 Tax=Kitasatospora sp. NPDC002227 TaxID=3154773 RepID=UPI00331B4D77
MSTTHPLVRAYLDTVERHTAPLPAEHRRELLADLAEHIDSALADTDAADETAVRLVLDQLGDPRRVADAALAEAGQPLPEPESPGRTRLTVLLALLPLPLLAVPALGPLLALAAAGTALWRLWKSPQWPRPEKIRAALFFASPLVVLPVLAAAFTLSPVGLTPTAVLAAFLAGFALPVLAAVRLTRSAARLRTA